MKKSITKSISQSEKFNEAARKAGADESEAAFEAKLKKIAKAKPKDKSELVKGR